MRTAMRIALPGSKNGINDHGDADIKSIEVYSTYIYRGVVDAIVVDEQGGVLQFSVSNMSEQVEGKDS